MQATTITELTKKQSCTYIYWQ